MSQFDPFKHTLTTISGLFLILISITFQLLTLFKASVINLKFIAVTHQLLFDITQINWSTLYVLSSCLLFGSTFIFMF